MNGDRYRADINLETFIVLIFKTVALRYFCRWKCLWLALSSGSPQPPVDGVVVAGSQRKQCFVLQLCKIEITPHCDLNRADCVCYPSAKHLVPILLFTTDGWGRRMLFYGLEHKLDTAVNGVRECVCLCVPPLVKRISPNTKLLFPRFSGVFSGLRRTLFSFAFRSRSAGFNTHPRHATKQKCTTVGFHLSFVHFKRFSRDSTPGDGGGLARLGVACALTE